MEQTAFYETGNQVRPQTTDANPLIMLIKSQAYGSLLGLQVMRMNGCEEACRREACLATVADRGQRNLCQMKCNARPQVIVKCFAHYQYRRSIGVGDP